MLGILVAATAFALAVTRVEDPDTWTHLALGRLMVESRGLPSHELLYARLEPRSYLAWRLREERQTP